MGMNDKQNRTVLFVHIPKTAGTTLRVWFTKQYAQQSWFVVHDDIQAERRRLAETPAAERKGYRMIFGHMEWGWHEHVPAGCAYAYTTMLRDPVERVLSLYSHSQVIGHYLQPAVEGMDIEKWLLSGVTMTADNGMVRQLCGRDTFLQKPWGDMAIPHGGVTRVDLEAAKDHLRQCALVGIAEKFDAYLDAGRREFGWRPCDCKWENVALWPRLKVEKLTKRQLRIVEQRTALDQELYNLAVELAGGQK